MFKHENTLRKCGLAKKNPALRRDFIKQCSVTLTVGYDYIRVSKVSDQLATCMSEWLIIGLTNHRFLDQIRIIYQKKSFLLNVDIKIIEF